MFNSHPNEAQPPEEASSITPTVIGQQQPSYLRDTPMRNGTSMPSSGAEVHDDIGTDDTGSSSELEEGEISERGHPTPTPAPVPPPTIRHRFTKDSYTPPSPYRELSYPVESNFEQSYRQHRQSSVPLPPSMYSYTPPRYLHIH
jgi:hypothetical protein